MSDVMLIECFNTFQGEGPDSGKSMLLTRFKYCDRNCFFCDTKVKMRISKEGIYPLNALQTQIDEHRLGLLITGGEPTFHKHYHDTIKLLTNLNYSIANVETNGCQLERLLNHKDWDKSIKFIYSPKVLDESSLYEQKNITEKILDRPNVYIKIPFHKNEFMLSYCQWLSEEMVLSDAASGCRSGEYDNKVWLMPLGVTDGEQKFSSADVMDACELYKFNFSGRLHVMYNFI